MDWSRWNSSADSQSHLQSSGGNHRVQNNSEPRHAPIRISENSVLLWHRYTGTSILSQGHWKLEVCEQPCTTHVTGLDLYFLQITGSLLITALTLCLFNRSNLSMVEFLLGEASLSTGSLHKFHGRGWLDHSQSSTIWFIRTMCMLRIFTHHLNNLNTSLNILRRFTWLYIVAYKFCRCKMIGHIVAMRSAPARWTSTLTSQSKDSRGSCALHRATATSRVKVSITWEPGRCCTRRCWSVELVDALERGMRDRWREENAVRFKGFTGWEPPCFTMFGSMLRMRKRCWYKWEGMGGVAKILSIFVGCSLSDHSHSSVGAVTCEVALLNQQYLLLRGDMQSTESPSICWQGASSVQTVFMMHFAFGLLHSSQNEAVSEAWDGCVQKLGSLTATSCRFLNQSKSLLFPNINAT